MSRKDNIDHQIKRALNSLDHIEVAKAPDFFYTRLEARMEAELLGRKSSVLWLSNIKLSLASLSLLLLVNFTSLVMLDTNSEDSSTKTVEIVSKDYFSSGDSYEYLNDY